MPVVKSDITLCAVYTEELQKYSVTWIMKTEYDSTFEITETYSYGTIPEYNGVMLAPENETFSKWDKEIVEVTENVQYAACYEKAKYGSATISSTQFVTVKGTEFTTTLYLSAVSGMTQTLITLNFDSAVAQILSYTEYENVTVISNDNDSLTLIIKNLSDDDVIPIMDVTLKTSETVAIGKNSFVTVISEDHINDVISTVDIYQTGDVSGDGVVNTRDLAMIRQYVVGKIELSDMQLYYANFYEDYDQEGKPKVNTRDIALLQQYIVSGK